MKSAIAVNAAEVKYHAANDAFVNAQARTYELLSSYEAAAAAEKFANLSRTGMLEAVYEAAQAYDNAFWQLAALREARDEALITACASYFEHLTSAKKPPSGKFVK
jgi:hypothetical protein